MARSTIQSRDLTVGDLVIEPRIRDGVRTECAFEVLRVDVGRFVRYVIADEAVAAGEDLRTYDGPVLVLRAAVVDARGPVVRCDAEAQLGTGPRVCDAALDRTGECPRAARHC